jgi:hypothetical protein
VARARLYFLDRDRQEVVDLDQTILSLKFLRLTAMLRIGPQWIIQDGLFDTGTALTVFPESIWRPLEASIDWLTFPAGKQPASWWTSVSGLTGGEFPCRIGRVEVIVFDFDANALSPARVIGKFVEDQGKLPRRVLLGLSHGILQGRKFHLAIDNQKAWLEDRS